MLVLLLLKRANLPAKGRQVNLPVHFPFDVPAETIRKLFDIIGALTHHSVVLLPE
jgi:hypothetical protein